MATSTRDRTLKGGLGTLHRTRYDHGRRARLGPVEDGNKPHRASTSSLAVGILLHGKGATGTEASRSAGQLVH
ncbi:hypothetical protein M514_28420 [Trichuris suis]|uniref:Uncharacterized protein n=1 Tax=Trichuris suis TaxID=68888 RepID=A0A085LJA8_9BILA|nr:hypothetical protein M513_14069 [Trichuris suis]KFD45807.1 hypothetical protein M513_13319 [Trichuris suis]KFD59401.1 hypothetical protein M514_28420 [Trichuris suis]